MKLPPAKILDQQDNKVVLDLVVARDLEAFQGHFPNNPILPGVVQVDWAVRFSARYLALEHAFAQDIQIKFRNVIVPEVPLSLTLQMDREKGKLTFSYASKDVIMSSGHIKIGLLA